MGSFKRLTAVIGLAMMLLCHSPSDLRATALLLDDLSLHLPWVVYQQWVFQVDLDYYPDPDHLYFAMSAAQLRDGPVPEGAETQLSDDLSMQIPLLSLQGELFSVDLTYAPDKCDACFLVSGAAAATAPPQRGDLESVELLAEMDTGQLASYFFSNGLWLPPQYGISLYKVTYRTVTPTNQLTLATGLMAIPDTGDDSAPLLSYQHYTITEKDTAPSAVIYDIPTIIAAATGYVVSSPDYLGLGDSTGLHPFVHAKSLATAVIDMLRAVRTYCASNGIALNEQLFLAGYSEGGYATMAAHKEMETNNAGEFQVTASAPAAGPYDLSQTMRAHVLSEAAGDNIYYLPYLVLAYNRIYGMADTASDLFVSPYDQSIPPLFNGATEADEINAALPADPYDLFAAQVLQPLANGGASPYISMLRENDAYRWVPHTPMRLYHCTGDQDVPYANSQVAYDYFTAMGASEVELISLNSGGHLACALPAMLQMMLWFDSLR